MQTTEERERDTWMDLCYDERRPNYLKVNGIRMHNSLRIGVLCLVVMYLYLLGIGCAARKQYIYQRYHYKKKPKVEKRYKNELSNCERSDKCLQLHGVEKTMCARQCMALDCFHELYGNDLLEEGEVDVRVTSFKGCWQKKYFTIARSGL
ncbi:uncharacterized protein [Antedon mediterranea]|uniref:uncharacterized protein n=1 Tax=Antedon mediterranea TaxID=105859 RepID=UPI003AF86FF5